MRFEAIDELLRHRNFAIFPTLGIEAEFGFGRNLNHIDRRVDVVPSEMHDFLFSKSGEKKREEQCVLVCSAGVKKLLEFRVAVFLR